MSVEHLCFICRTDDGEEENASLITNIFCFFHSIAEGEERFFLKGKLCLSQSWAGGCGMRRRRFFGTIKSHLCVYYMRKMYFHLISFSRKIMLKVVRWMARGRSSLRGEWRWCGGECVVKSVLKGGCGRGMWWYNGILIAVNIFEWKINNQLEASSCNNVFLKVWIVTQINAEENDATSR